MTSGRDGATTGSPSPYVRFAGSTDAALVATLLADIFSEDPWVLHQFPRESLRSRLRIAYQAYFELLALRPFRAWVVDDLRAVAVWHPPSAMISPSDLLRLDAVVAPLMAQKRDAALEAQQWASQWLPSAAHWRLDLLGVSRGSRRRGLGTAVVAPGLEAASKEGLPVAVQTSTEAGATFYGALGFRVVHCGTVPDGPRVWTMCCETPLISVG